MFVPLLAAVLFLLLVPAADAAQPVGSPIATIEFGAKGQGLRADGVRVTATGRAKVMDAAVGLPIVDVSVGASSRASMVLSGSIKLKKGRRNVKLRGLLVRIDHRKIRITGKIGSRRTTIFTGTSKKQPRLNATLVLAETSASKLTLTRAAARLIRRTIHSFPARARRVGAFDAAAWVTPPPPDDKGTIDPGTAAQCKPTGSPPPDPARPVTSIDITCATLVWHIRDSWVGYTAQSVPVAPAVGLAPIKGSDHVCPDDPTTKEATFSFSLPVLSGWWDPVSSTGKLSSTGGERSWVDHGSTHVDIEIHDVELRFNGASSELWANVHSRSNTDPETDVRVHFGTFNALTPIAGGPFGPGTPMSRARISFTPEGDAAFKNYSPGAGFGCIDVGFNF